MKPDHGLQLLLWLLLLGTVANYAFGIMVRMFAG